MDTQSTPPKRDTPPDSFTNQPLTPSPADARSDSVSRIIKEVRNRQQGRSWTDITWANYTLDPEGYEDLLHRFQSDEDLWGYVDDKLHCDYFPSANRLVLRSRTQLHGLFLGGIVSEIHKQLESIEGTSAVFAKEVYCCGSATITFPEKEYGRHDPDTQFGHLKARYPGVVIEVSDYWQKRKDLSRLANDYILGSDANICAVLAFDIECKSSKEATLSVWRPRIITNKAGEKELVAQQVVKNQAFRDGSGEPNISPTGGFQLCLRDFATEAVPGPGQLRDPIIISASTLCAFLQCAEDQATLIEQHRGLVSPNTFVIKRRRDPTPPERLTHQGEKRVRANENRTEDETTKVDSL